MSEDSVQDDGGKVDFFHTIIFRERTLSEWENYLTVTVPSMPAHSVEISNVLADISNRYQICYNCFNEIMTMVKELDSELRVATAKGIQNESSKLKSAGSNRLPSREILESLAIKNDKELSDLHERRVVYESVQDFFENNKNKLAVVLRAVSDILYSCTQSDRILSKTPTGGL